MIRGGQSIRIRAATVRETGRNAQGVKLLTLKEGELLQDIAWVVPDDEDEGGPENPEVEGDDPQAPEEAETGEAGDVEQRLLTRRNPKMTLECALLCGYT
jgi:DNA gyrase subunit A